MTKKEQDRLYRERLKNDPERLAKSRAASNKRQKRLVERRKLQPKQSVTTIRCYKCGEYKDTSQFSRNITTKTGYRTECKKCVQIINRQQYYKSNWGLSMEEVEDMQKSQGYRCGACGNQSKKLSLDHNHDTGLIREFLCDACNCALGYVQDDISRLKQIIAYLEKHSDKNNPMTQGKRCLKPHRTSSLIAKSLPPTASSSERRSAKFKD